MYLSFVNFNRHVPDDHTTLKNESQGTFEEFGGRTSGMLPKRFFTRNSDMILVPTVGLYRASMFVPLNEQGMVMEGETI